MGPVLFTLYSQPLSDVISQHKCLFHKYVDDTKSCLVEDFKCAKLSIQECISAISCWMDSNKLMLNVDKTEVLIVGTAYCVEQLDCDAIKILDTDISLQKSVKYLGVRMDQTLSISNHISDVCHSSFLSLRRIGSIRPYLTEKATACLINSVVTLRLDFCNSTLTGITSDQINRLQRVQNCSACLIAKRESTSIVHPSSLSFTGCFWNFVFNTNWLFWLSVILRLLFLHICPLFCTFVNHHMFFAHLLKIAQNSPG